MVEFGLVELGNVDLTPGDRDRLRIVGGLHVLVLLDFADDVGARQQAREPVLAVFVGHLRLDDVAEEVDDVIAVPIGQNDRPSLETRFVRILHAIAVDVLELVAVNRSGEEVAESRDPDRDPTRTGPVSSGPMRVLWPCFGDRLFAADQ